MSEFEISVTAAAPADTGAIEQVLDAAFGIDRRIKTSYRLREGQAPIDGLSFVVRDRVDAVVGTISFWPLAIGAAARPALLLGPLAVQPRLQGSGIGQALMHCGLEEAKDHGHRLVLLVGDAPYYARAGFARVPDGKLELPGPADPDRLLYRELVPGSLDGVAGLVLPPGRR